MATNSLCAPFMDCPSCASRLFPQRRARCSIDRLLGKGISNASAGGRAEISNAEVNCPSVDSNGGELRRPPQRGLDRWPMFVRTVSNRLSGSKQAIQPVTEDQWMFMQKPSVRAAAEFLIRRPLRS